MFYGITLNNVAAAVSEVLFSTAAPSLMNSKRFGLRRSTGRVGWLGFQLEIVEIFPALLLPADLNWKIMSSSVMNKLDRPYLKGKKMGACQDDVF